MPSEDGGSSNTGVDNENSFFTRAELRLYNNSRNKRAKLGTGIIEFVNRGIPFTCEDELLIQFRRQRMDTDCPADFLCLEVIIVEL